MNAELPAVETVETDRTPADVKLFVVVLNFNGLGDTLECVASLQAAGWPDGQIVVVDNASAGDDSQVIQAQFPRILFYQNHENQGWAGGNNRGIEVALQQGADWVFLLNNDTVVATDLKPCLLQAIEHGSWDLLGPVINEFADREVVQTEGVQFNPQGSAEFFASVPVLASSEPIVEVDIINGCAVAISRAVFETIGLIDEQFFLICEESDFCLRAQEAGFRGGVIGRSLVWHKHSVSFARAGKPLQRYYGIRNLLLLLRKHPAGAGRNGRWRSSFECWRWGYHLFCFEAEHRHWPGTRAVTEGLSDGLCRRYGPRQERRRPLARLLHACFYGVWKLRGGKAHPAESLSVPAP